MKRKLIVFVVAFFVITTTVVSILIVRSKDKTEIKIEKPNKKFDRKKLKNLKPNLGFKQVQKEIKFENLNLPGEIGKFGVYGNDMESGKIIRVLRFANITDKVEEGYDLPQYLIAGMMAEESSGMDLLPNGLGDGGFGLCHMQGVVAREFGLKTFNGCCAMVCNGKDHRSCKKNGKKVNHAGMLKREIDLHFGNRSYLISLDDRLHPIINLDAVGRMMRYHADGRKIKGLSATETALYRYAGKYNYRKYARNVFYYMKLMKNKKFMDELEEKFNKMNPNLKINGQKGNFKMYLEVSRAQNINYGLSEYKPQ